MNLIHVIKDELPGSEDVTQLWQRITSLTY